MAREIYLPAKAIDIPSVAVTSVGQADISQNDLFEDVMIPDFSVGVVGSKGHKKTTGAISLSRPTAYHGRSYDVGYQGIKPFVWEDENGIRYSTYTTKGNNFTDIRLITSGTAPSGFAIKGLQDTDCLERVVSASIALRGLGIESENIVRVLVPEQIPFEGRMVTQEELKAALIERELLEKPIKPSDGVKTWTGGLTDIIEQDREKRKLAFLRDTRFVTTVRAMQVSERITDLFYAKTKREATALLKNAFDFLNLSEVLEAEKEGRPVDIIDPKNGGDVWVWLSSTLPLKLGRSFGKMHNAGLVHKFPHAGNISIIGSIYDLDSVEGPSLGLGDEEFTPTKAAEDLRYLLSQSSGRFPGQTPQYLPEAIKVFFEKGFYEKDLKKPFEELGLDEDYNIAEDFCLNLLSAYLEEYEGEIDIFSNSEILYQIVIQGLLLGRTDILDELFEKSNIDYKLEATDDEIVSGYAKFVPHLIESFLAKLDVNTEYGRVVEVDDEKIVRTFSRAKVIAFIKDEVINNDRNHGVYEYLIYRMATELDQKIQGKLDGEKWTKLVGLAKLYYIRSWINRVPGLVGSHEAEILDAFSSQLPGVMDKYLKERNPEFVPEFVD